MSEPPSHHRPDQPLDAAGTQCEGDSPHSWAEELERCRGVLDAVLSHRLPHAADREDCLQTIFVLAMQHGSQVAPAFRRAWLFKTAANQAALYWRKKRIDDKAIDAIGHAIEETLPLDDPVEQAERTRKLMGELERLPPKAYEMIRLKFFEDLTYQQIADRLHVPLGTALTTVRRTLMRLREHWTDHDS